MFDPTTVPVVVPVVVDWTPIVHEIVAMVGSVLTLAVTALAAYFANRTRNDREKTRTDREGTRQDRAATKQHASNAKKSALYVEQSLRPPAERSHPLRRAADHPSNARWSAAAPNHDEGDPQP